MAASLNFQTNLATLQATVVQLWVKDQASAEELGRALRCVRDEMKAFKRRGAFKKWFLAQGMDENRVYYCIRLVEGKVIGGPLPLENVPAPENEIPKPLPNLADRINVPYATELITLAQARGLPAYELLTSILAAYVAAHKAELEALEVQLPF
jgi:hypothetical protein